MILAYLQEASGPIPALGEWLQGHPVLASIIAIALLIVLAYLADRLSRWVLNRTVSRVVKRTSVSWDDVLQQHRLFVRLAHLAPVLAIYYGIEAIPGLPAAVVEPIQAAALAALVVVALLAVDSLITAAGELYARSDLSHGRPIKGYIQGAKVILYVLGAILVIATLTGRSPMIMLSGFAAFSAVLLLIFRDTILSFVASSQIASYDMMREGDWIEMPEYGADGDVIDIGLHTIKVQNWDKTITSIPTHKFLSDSFKNWRAMSEAGGRRIKRSVHIDMSSIRFLDAEDVERFKRFVLLQQYMKQKEQELRQYNEAQVGDSELQANARRLTNIGTFRAYVTRYLRERADVHPEMTLMVRQLSPTPQGLPLEIYCFTSDTRWLEYERIQSDIFDHIIAIIPQFGLRVFQAPTGADIENAVATQRGARETGAPQP